MKKRKLGKTVRILLLAGWCLLFLRCESTAKSMVRAVYLAQDGTEYQVGLLYQAPEAAADAAEASAALQFVQAQASGLEAAFAAAEQQLPQAASYRLCDYLLLPQTLPESVLTAYEQLLLRRPCGRMAAKLVCAAGDPEELVEASMLPDALMDALRQNTAVMPRFYQRQEGILLPGLQWQNKTVEPLPGGVLYTAVGPLALDAAQAEAYRLLSGMGGSRSFWLEDAQVRIRRSTVTVTLGREAVLVRLDCQRLYQSVQPTAAQCAALAEHCNALVQLCWQQGIDLLHLEQRAALQYGTAEGFVPTKNACPQLRTDVRFLPF